MKKITVQLLVELNACQDQVDLFQEVFGDEAEVTIENVSKAIENRLDISWFGHEVEFQASGYCEMVCFDRSGRSLAELFCEWWKSREE